MAWYISPYLLAIIISWVSAHIIKYINCRSGRENSGLKNRLFMSGGMPSSHSAATMSLATLIGLICGIESGLFGLAILFALIVMYDAVKVRRSTGEQGVAIQQLIKEQGSKVKLPRAAKGHTPLEVALGALLGVAVGLVVFWTIK